jgi:O-antigen ligase
MTEAVLAAPAESRSDSAAAAVRAAYFAFILWVPLETVDLFQAQGKSRVISLSRLLGFLLFGLALFDRRRCFRHAPAVFWGVAWYIAAYSASQLGIARWLDGPFLATQVILCYSAVLFLVSLNLFADEEFRRAALRFYGWCAALVAVGMLLGAFGGPARELDGRVSILGQDPNAAAGFFALGALCLAGDTRLFERGRLFVRFLLTPLALGALLVGILQTESRGGMLAFVAGILGLAVCGGKGARGKRLMLAGVAILGLGLMVLREFEQNTSLSVRLADSWYEGDTAGRTHIYETAWAMFLEKPLMGYGGANNMATLGMTLKFISGNVYYRDTHNLLLMVLTEVGVVGAAPFLAAILYALWLAWRHGRRTDDPAPFALMCAQLTICSSLTGTNQNLFWIVLAAAASCGLNADAAS